MKPDEVKYGNMLMNAETGFTKFDAGKIKYSVFPNSVLEDVIRVMMFGANKYGMDNWKLCEDPTRYYDAGRRHEESWKSGEKFDPESGLPHLAHAICNWVFAHYIDSQERKENGFVSHK